MVKFDEQRRTSEQDFGPWLDAATLFETDDGQVLLKVESGYSKPYEVAWYSLSEKPKEALQFTGGATLHLGTLWANHSEDDSSFWEEVLEVVVHKVERPEG